MPSALPVRKRKLIPELLAPAGSPEALRAAVTAGADAVYLSGKKFGARRSAPNFTEEEIMEAVRYAHRRDVSIYITLNTLIHDRELPAVAEYLIRLYSIGVDAVLVQDMGVAALARTLVPRLPLHASTQMTIHSPEGVLWAAEQGFSRVVLARELTLEDVTRISEETAESGIGLEVFAHGALCYSYSGQCLLSSVIGGRSGNRGMCAQPCRKPYTLLSGDADEYGLPTGLHEVSSPERYLLSPKDLCTYELLPNLVSSPIDLAEDRRSYEITGICCNCCLDISAGTRCNCSRKNIQKSKRPPGSLSCLQSWFYSGLSFGKTQRCCNGEGCTGQPRYLRRCCEPV